MDATTIIRYLNHTATTEEKEELLQWLKLDEKNKKFFSEFMVCWTTSETALIPESQIKNAFERFKSDVAQSDILKIKRKYLLWKIAASVAIFVCCGLSVLLVGKGVSFLISNEQCMVINQALMGNGSKGSITLPDGTTAWLNAGSKLTYPATFSSTDRRVSLEGEAFFKVQRNEKIPFIVETKDMDVKVLGTSFNLRSYANREIAEMVLLTGKVEVSSKKNNRIYTLSPNQKYSLNKRTGNDKVSIVDAAEYNVWINDDLTFSNEPLSEIFRKIEHWYGVDIRYTPNVPLKLPLSLTIRKESKEEIFNILEMIAPIRCRIHENEIVVSPR